MTIWHLLGAAIIAVGGTWAIVCGVGSLIDFLDRINDARPDDDEYLGSC